MSQPLDFFAPRHPVASASFALRALTLWRPWPAAILHGGKRIENRPWKPWPAVLGQRIALHSGERYDRDHAALIARVTGKLWNPTDVPAGCIVGVATVAGYVTAQRAVKVAIAGYAVDADTILRDPWYMAPQVAWLLTDVRGVDPVPCRGGHKLWTVPTDAAARVLAQLEPHARAAP